LFLTFSNNGLFLVECKKSIVVELCQKWSPYETKKRKEEERGIAAVYGWLRFVAGRDGEL